MKREARILLSACEDSVCCGLVLRGEGFDTVLLARGCEELCSRAKERGYMDELRYQLGDCDCGLPSPPRRIAPPSGFAAEIARSALRLISLHREERGDLCE